MFSPEPGVADAAARKQDGTAECNQLADGCGVNERGSGGGAVGFPQAVATRRGSPAEIHRAADRDGHALEFIALLNDPDDPDFVGPLSTWQRKRSLALAQNTNPPFHGNQPT